ncbi:MAG: PAS domain S-box protein [Saprospiraceae bacterium]
MTVIETTEKVKAVNALKESKQELQFAVEAAELGTWDLNPATNKFRGNSRLKEWFGLKQDEEIELSVALSKIADKDRDKVAAAIQTALQFSSGGHFDIIYTIIHPQTKNARIVRAKGLASFNDEGIAYRFNGTLQDVTKEIVTLQLLTESEQHLRNERMVLYNSFMNAPAGIAILKGDTHLYEFVNAEYEKLVDRKITLGKTVQENFPEIEKQGLLAILDHTFSKGEPFFANEFPVELINKSTGEPVLRYYNSVMQPIKDEKGNTERILSHGVEVTQQVTTRKLIEEANKQLRTTATLTENIADAVIGTDMDYKTISWNKGAENLYGYTSEEVIGNYAMHLLRTEFLSDDDKQTWSKALDDTGKWQGEVVQSKKDGTLVSVLVSLAYVYDENNKPIAAFAVNRDITERKKAEEKIKASEAKFRMLSETIPHMICTATPDGKKNYFNQYFLDYTGLSFEELKDDGMLKIIFPEDLEEDLRRWHYSLKTGEDFMMEKRIRHHDGSYRWHLSHSLAQKDENGNIIAWIGSSTEIEEQKKSSEELEVKVKERTNEIRIQNETFKLAEKTANFGSYKWNITTGSLEYSDNLFRLFDCKPQEFIPSFEVFLSFIHPDDLQQVIINGEQTLQTGKLVETPFRIISKTGRTKHFRSSGTFSGEGANHLLIGTVQDISKDVLAAEELAEKEDYLNQIISNAPDAVIVMDQASIITLWNPKTEEIFGWKAEEVLGQHLTDTIIPHHYREDHKAGMKRFIETGEAKILNHTLELTALHKEGKEFPISITISQAMQQGTFIFIAFLRDITSEKQNKEELIVKTRQLEEINQTLELKNKELEYSNDELASFSYVASHDLQEPLRKIQAFGSRIIETEKLSDKSQDYFNRIIAAGERMQNLIVSLLAFSRTNTTELIFEPCDLNTIVEESKMDLDESILEKQAVIDYENLPTIKGVRIQIAQLFTNLMDNAIKYSQPEIKPHIKITASFMEGNEIAHPAANKHHKYHVIKIADNGIGFDNEYGSKIFELFQRLHHKNEYSGTGIGLAIVKKIVTNHNGFIVADGKLNLGSKFTIYIPSQ